MHGIGNSLNGLEVRISNSQNITESVHTVHSIGNRHVPGNMRVDTSLASVVKLAVVTSVFARPNSGYSFAALKVQESSQIAGISPTRILSVLAAVHRVVNSCTTCPQAGLLQIQEDCIGYIEKYQRTL
jgi:hypothetical protein